MKWFVVFSILFAGHIPAFKTALLTENYLSLVDYVSIFAGWSFSMLILELWNQHDFRKELERRTKC